MFQSIVFLSDIWFFINVTWITNDVIVVIQRLFYYILLFNSDKL